MSLIFPLILVQKARDGKYWCTMIQSNHYDFFYLDADGSKHGYRCKYSDKLIDILAFLNKYYTCQLVIDHSDPYFVNWKTNFEDKWLFCNCKNIL
jgi:hypothetical protein